MNNIQLDPNQTAEIMKTSDYPLAATLNVLGFDVIGIDKGNIKRVLFYFKRTQELDRNIEQYLKNEIRVSPVDYERSKKQLRTHIFTDYESHHKEY